MAISPTLRNRLIATASSGSLLIATVLLGGEGGLEGRAYYPYKDVAGIWTVCDGHTGKDIIVGKKYSNEECNDLLKADLLPVEQAVNKSVIVPLNEYQRAALYSFTFNVGISAFKNSSLLKKINAGDYQGACNEMRRWIYSGGKKWHGLVNRREVERMLCLLENTNELVNR